MRFEIHRTWEGHACGVDEVVVIDATLRDAWLEVWIDAPWHGDAPPEGPHLSYSELPPKWQLTCRYRAFQQFTQRLDEAYQGHKDKLEGRSVAWQPQQSVRGASSSSDGPGGPSCALAFKN